MTTLVCPPFMRLGLETAGFSKWETYLEHRNIDRFRSWYGCRPAVCEAVWIKLQEQNVDEEEEACGGNGEQSANPMHLLLGLRFLWEYSTEVELAGLFKMNEKVIRKYCGMYANRIQLLLADMIASNWDEAISDELVFFLSVDGTHCPIQEPRPFSTKWSSFKLGGKPGVNYEIGLSIKQSKLIWINGPTAPGEQNDLAVFRQGLKARLPPGKRVIADKGYCGEDEFVSTYNDLDPRELASFKERVCARHETFNKRVKMFSCLSKPFRHGVENHKIAFEAICVLTMLDFEHSPLFDAWVLDKKTGETNH